VGITGSKRKKRSSPDGEIRSIPSKRGGRFPLRLKQRLGKEISPKKRGYARSTRCRPKEKGGKKWREYLRQGETKMYCF